MTVEALNGEFLSCDSLRTKLVFYKGRFFRACCSQNRVFPMADYADGKFDLSGVAEKRRRIEADLNAGRPNPCSGCPCLRRGTWSDSPYLISQLHISLDSFCNIDCIYCNISGLKKEYDDGGDARMTLDILSDIYANGWAAPDMVVTPATGEPLIQKGFADIAAKVMGYKRNTLFLATNLTRYEPALEDGVDANRVRFHPSIDAGTRETYRTVKRRDLFEAVSKNILRYARINPESIYLKYICMPENSNSRDREGVLDLAERAGLSRLWIVFDVLRKPDNRVLDFIGELKHFAVRKGLSVSLFHTEYADALFPEMPIRKEIEDACRRRISGLDGVPGSAAAKPFCGRLETVIRANDGGLWLNGWAYDKMDERECREVAVFWNGQPLFAGPCRHRRDYVRPGVRSGFSFHSGDREVADAALADTAAMHAYARFGDSWVSLGNPQL